MGENTKEEEKKAQGEENIVLVECWRDWGRERTHGRENEFTRRWEKTPVIKSLSVGKIKLSKVPGKKSTVIKEESKIPGGEEIFN